MMMKKLFSLIALTGVLVTTGLSTPPLLHAQMTKSKARAGMKKAGRVSKLKWDSLSPEEQQKFRELAQQSGQDAQARWESMTPEQQQQFRQQAKVGGARLKKWWDQLPQ